MVLNGLWSRFVEYFSVEVVGDDPLPKDRSAVYAVIPHGTFPFGLGVVSACKREGNLLSILVVLIVY